MNKTCTVCGRWLPATTEYFHARHGTKCGLKPRCKECRNIQNRNYSRSIKGRQASRRGKYKYYSTIKGYLQKTYKNILNRCNNNKHPYYKYYGGRGIECKFKNLNDFRDYVINELKADPRGLDCDRIDNNGHYEKGNIQFITHKENVRK